jgi:hypothetical protein
MPLAGVRLFTRTSARNPAVQDAEDEPSGRRRIRLSPKQAVLTAGAIAGALASVIGLGTTVGSWFESDPEGIVKSLKLQSVRPLTYGEWRSHEGVSNAGVPEDQLRQPGKLITYDIETRGYKENAELQVRIILHDATSSRSDTTRADPIKVKAGEDCGCFDWVAIPRTRHRYYLEVAVFPPGPVRGQPLKTAATEFFRGS